VATPITIDKEEPVPIVKVDVIIDVSTEVAIHIA
jgi:hypothetical protein